MSDDRTLAMIRCCEGVVMLAWRRVLCSLFDYHHWVDAGSGRPGVLFGLPARGVVMNKPGGPIMDCCPSCGSPDSHVRDSRPMPGYPTWRRRRRFCASEACGARWWTVELPEEFLVAGRVTVPEVVRVVETALRELERLKDRLVFEDPPVPPPDKWTLHHAEVAIHDRSGCKPESVCKGGSDDAA